MQSRHSLYQSIYLSIYLLFDGMHFCSGDAVVYGADRVTVVIEANDDANGIFYLETTKKSVEEGKTNYF